MGGSAVNHSTTTNVQVVSTRPVALLGLAVHGLVHVPDVPNCSVRVTGYGSAASALLTSQVEVQLPLTQHFVAMDMDNRR